MPFFSWNSLRWPRYILACSASSSSDCTTLFQAGRHAPANISSTTNIRATITATLLLFGRSTSLLPAICPTFSICSKAVSSRLVVRQGPIGSRGLQRRSLSTTPHTRLVNSADDYPLGKMTERGAFILFEGVDRCGKTTQANLLVENLTKAGHDACFMRFPGERPTVLQQASGTQQQFARAQSTAALASCKVSLQI